MKKIDSSSNTRYEFRLNYELKQELYKKAAELGVTVPEFIQTCVIKEIKRKGTNLNLINIEREKSLKKSRRDLKKLYNVLYLPKNLLHRLADFYDMSMSLHGVADMEMLSKIVLMHLKAYEHLPDELKPLMKKYKEEIETWTKPQIMLNRIEQYKRRKKLMQMFEDEVK